MKGSLYFKQILPVVLTQILIRLFHVSDFRIVVGLGEEVRLIHAVQHHLSTFGQFVGSAGLTTLLVLWPRFKEPEQRARLLSATLVLTVALCLLVTIVIRFSGDTLAEHFKFAGVTQSFSGSYLSFGCINMALLAVQLCLDGALLSVGLQRFTLLNTAILAVGNLLFDVGAVHLFKEGRLDLPSAALAFVGGTSLWFLLGIVISVTILRRHLPFRKLTDRAAPGLFGVWKHEVGIAITRSISPLWYAYQVGGVAALGPFLVTYQAALHVAYIAAVPLAGALPVAVRDCSREISGKGAREPGTWLKELIFFTFLPCTAFLFLAAILGRPLLETFFQVQASAVEGQFLSLFFVGCGIGQLGHVISVPLRANLKNHLLTRWVVISELLANNLGFLFLSRQPGFHVGWLGYLTLGYASLYTSLVFLSVTRLQRKNGAPMVASA